MQKTSFSPFIKKFLPLIIIIIILGVAAILFFTLRAPKVEPLTSQQKQDFLNYIDTNKIKPSTKKEKTDFIKSTEAQPALSEDAKASFAKSIR